MNFLGNSKSRRASKSHHWFKSYGDFAEWMDFAHWWSFIGKGLLLQPAQQACFLYSILRIMNLKGHPNWIIGSKVMMFFKTFFTMFFIHDKLGFFYIWNQSAVDNGGGSRGRSVAVGVSDR